MPPVMIRPLAFVVAALSAAALWLVSASAVWSEGTGTPFTPLAWWDATQWWLANWWVNLWLVLAATVPTVFLLILLLGLFQIWRLHYRGPRKLATGQGSAVRAIASAARLTTTATANGDRSPTPKSCSPGLTRSMAASSSARRTASITIRPSPASPSVPPTRAAGAWAARPRS